MKLFLSFCLSIIAFSSNAQEQRIAPDFAYRYSVTDSINGCQETARRVKFFMENQKYSSAIGYFSDEQQKNIEYIRQDEERYNMWLDAWKINDLQLTKYLQMIEQGKGSFVFENEIWKIDEK